MLDELLNIKYKKFYTNLVDQISKLVENQNKVRNLSLDEFTESIEKNTKISLEVKRMYHHITGQKFTDDLTDLKKALEIGYPIFKLEQEKNELIKQKNDFFNLYVKTVNEDLTLIETRDINLNENNKFIFQNTVISLKNLYSIKEKINSLESKIQSSELNDIVKPITDLILSKHERIFQTIESYDVKNDFVVQDLNSFNQYLNTIKDLISDDDVFQLKDKFKERKPYMLLNQKIIAYVDSKMSSEISYLQKLKTNEINPIGKFSIAEKKKYEANIPEIIDSYLDKFKLDYEQIGFIKSKLKYNLLFNEIKEQQYKN